MKQLFQNGVVYVSVLRHSELVHIPVSPMKIRKLACPGGLNCRNTARAEGYKGLSSRLNLEAVEEKISCSFYF